MAQPYFWEDMGGHDPIPPMGFAPTHVDYSNTRQRTVKMAFSLGNGYFLGMYPVPGTNGRRGISLLQLGHCPFLKMSRLLSPFSRTASVHTFMEFPLCSLFCDGVRRSFTGGPDPMFVWNL